MPLTSGCGQGPVCPLLPPWRLPLRPAGSSPGPCTSTAFSGKLLGFGTLGFPDRPAYSIRGPVHVSTVYNPAAYSIWVQKSTNAFILI